MSEIQSTQVLDRDDQQPIQKPLEIPGYTLESRLGVGGYGEVWKAIGPGGLAKAVKILFGKMDGPQADAELKSLERMRDLRHPFLLSIERIQVVEGRLVVVTELADSCLDKRFRAVRAEGQRGVPREELLGYLRDSADALDFMLEEHGLQHLDIKPERISCCRVSTSRLETLAWLRMSVSPTCRWWVGSPRFTHRRKFLKASQVEPATSTVWQSSIKRC